MRSLIVGAPVLALLAGCPGAGDDGLPTDSGPSTGLTISWSSRPGEVPGEGIESAVFRLANVRVVGDAGPLSLAAQVLQWATGEAPTDLTVADAPSGLYSRIIFELAPMSGAPAYELSGTVDVDDETHPFTIRDHGTSSVSVDYTIRLSPGGDARIPIRVDLRELVSVIDFDQLTLQDGRYLIEDGNAQLTRVRDELPKAFEIVEE